MVRCVRGQAGEAGRMSLALLPIELPEDLEYADLVVLSDMHVGDPLFDEQLFFRVRDWVLAEPNRYVICNGDLMNTATKDSVSDVYRETDRKSTRLNSSHVKISYAVFCLKKKKQIRRLASALQ